MSKCNFGIASFLLCSNAHRLFFSYLFIGASNVCRRRLTFFLFPECQFFPHIFESIFKYLWCRQYFSQFFQSLHIYLAIQW